MTSAKAGPVTTRRYRTPTWPWRRLSSRWQCGQAIRARKPRRWWPATWVSAQNDSKALQRLQQFRKNLYGQARASVTAREIYRLVLMDARQAGVSPEDALRAGRLGGWRAK